MTDDAGETMRLATTAPSWAVRKAAREMKNSGLPLEVPNLLRFAIARLIGIPEDQISDFVLARSGRKPLIIDDFLTDIQDEQETS